MRFWSTPETALNSELSVLAVCETMLAMGGYVWISIHLETWWPIWAAAMVAPFMLLRTEESVILGWDLAQKFDQIFGKGLNWKVRGCVGAAALIIGGGLTLTNHGTGAMLASFALTMVVTSSILYCWLPAVTGRIVGGWIAFFTSPIRSIKAIPGNWWRLSMCTDFGCSPEVLPRPADVDPEINGYIDYRAWEAVAYFYRFSNLKRDRVAYIGVSAIPLIVPALWLRLSIKSTAAIWLPLIWAAKAPKPAGEPWSAHVRLKVADDLTRIVVLVSLGSIFLSVSKLALFVAENEWAMKAHAWTGWLGERLGEFAVAFVRPGEIPIWQIASTVNAILAIALFLLLRHWCRRAEVGLTINDSGIDRTVSSFYFVRRLLSTYTIGNHLVVFYLLAREMPLPTIGTTLFPWV